MDAPPAALVYGELGGGIRIGCGTKKLDDNDRVCHETRVLVDIVYYRLCFDQLNTGPSAVVELAYRRLQAVTSAHSNPSKVNWSTARLMTVAASVDDGV